MNMCDLQVLSLSFIKKSKYPLNIIFLPIRGSIKTIVWQEVVVQFPEDVQCDAAIRCRDIVICFSKHRVEFVKI